LFEIVHFLLQIRTNCKIWTRATNSLSN